MSSATTNISIKMKLCIIFTLLFAKNITCEELSDDTLMYVHVVARHGARTPDHRTTYPNMPNKEETYYPFGIGELNLLGKRQMYQVGKTLRDRYGKFLGYDYKPKLAKIISSEIERCRMSTQALLTGLFPPSDQNKLMDKLNWQPILYSYVKRKNDHLIATFASCKYMLKLKITDDLSRCEDRISTYRYLSKYSGWNVTSPVDVVMIMDNLLSQQANGFDLPEWMKRIYPQPLLECAMDVYRLFLSNDTRLSYFGGNLIKSILQDSLSKINEEPQIEEQKLSLYIGHDANIHVLLYIMDLFGDVINSAAYLIFELHNINGVYGFKIYLDNNNETGLRLLDIPNYGTFCSFDKMFQEYKKYFPIGWCPY